MNAFKDRDTVLIGISIDSTHTHNAWRNTKINDGGLADVAPTILAMMHLPQPAEMNGISLIGHD